MSAPTSAAGGAASVCHNRRHRRRFNGRRMTEILDRIDQPMAGRHGCPTHRIEHLRQSVMPALHQANSSVGLAANRPTDFRKGIPAHGRGRRSGRSRPSARATLGVQIAQQGFDFLSITRLGLPAQQRGAGVFDDVETFFEKDLQQLRIVTGAAAIGGGWRRFGDAGPRRTWRIASDRAPSRLMVLQLIKQQRRCRDS